MRDPNPVSRVRSRARFWAIVPFVLLVFVASPAIPVAPPTSAATGAINRVYLPLVSNGVAVGDLSLVGPPRLGVWIGGGDQSTVSSLAGTGARWTRVMYFWSTVEPKKGSYSFSAYDDLLRSLHDAGISVILEVRRNPSWAASTICGPIGDLDAFEAFVQATVAHYSSSEFGVKSYEFYNEPDSRFAAAAGENTGCWGDHPDLYAQMLARAQRATKAADSTSLVVFGGLAYDWNENPLCNHQNCANLDFLDQVLAQTVNGRPAGDYFDVANVHYYSSQYGRWSSYGGDVAGKVTSLRQVMARHNVTKPVVLSESGWTTVADPELQARYVPKLLARGLAADLDAIIWFCLADWNGADFPYGLLAQNGQPRPAYSAYQIAARELGTTSSVRALAPADLGGATGFEGYAFDANGQTRWVLWARAAGATDGGTSQVGVTIPGSATAAFDKLGGSVPLRAGGTPYTLSDDPIYVRY